MSWSSTIFHRNRRSLNLTAAMAVLLLVAVSGNDVRPFLGNISTSIFYAPFYKLKEKIENLQSLAEENRALKKQLVEMNLQLGALQEARRENWRLRESMGLKPPADFHIVPVRLVAVIEQFYPIGAVINKGSDDGIRVNQAIVNRYGLVGKIKETLAHSAAVQLLTDPGNAVAIRVAETHQMGTVRYSPEKGMILNNLPADAQVKKGDLIVTSGLGGIYPAGLTVARVDSVLPNTGEIFKSVRLKSAANFSELDELFVLTGGGQ